MSSELHAQDVSPLPSSQLFLVAWAGLIVLQALALAVMGRPWICTCGDIKLWHGVVESSGNSQHLTDWYTPSHVIHGFLFYAGLRWLFPRWSWSKLLLAAVALEVTWEVVENSSIIIDRYRAETIALDYYGDSILNSVSDTVAMIIGFALAAVWPVWLSVLVVIGLEVFVGLAIRDNLLLNVIMLVWPLDAIKEWQSVGGWVNSR